MKTLLFLLVSLMLPLAAACGSSDSDDRLPPANGEYERVLEVPGSNVETPDFTLNSASGDVVRLSDYLGNQPVAVIFYRGFF